MLENVNAQDIKKNNKLVSANCNFLQIKNILQINIQSDYVFTTLESKYLMVSIFLPYNYFTCTFQNYCQFINFYYWNLEMR